MTREPPIPEHGSDMLAGLLVEAGVEHVALNPGATVRGIHDSLVHYGQDAPSLVLCAHEEIAVAAAQAYAKVAGKPMAVLVHDVVGLQHASMAIYNAWCDRVPMLLIGGTGPLSKARRRPWIDWVHTASVQAELVRHFVKWDDQPHDLASVPESFARALHTTVSVPAGPVYLCYDVDLQEQPFPETFTPEPIARYVTPTPPAPGAASLDRVAGLLRRAERPVIVAGHCGDTAQGFVGLGELAEALAAPVVDAGQRFNVPTTHELNVTGVDAFLDEADLVLVLDVDDLRGTLPRQVGDGGAAGTATVVNITPGHLALRGWAHDYQALAPVAHHITATGEAAVTGLLERLRAEPPDAEARERRRLRVAERVAAQRSSWRSAAAAVFAEGAVPLERLLYELGEALRGQRYVLANGTNARLEHRLWEMTEPRQYAGWHAGGGLGYGLGAAIGASLAAGPDVVSVDVQSDGDLLYTPAALWTMAHLRLPVLIVMQNNRQYGNTVEHAAALARLRGRPVARRYAGAALTDPAVDYAALAASFGVWSTGPVTDVDVLAPALTEAVKVARSGRPALVDVVTPGC